MRAGHLQGTAAWCAACVGVGAAAALCANGEQELGGRGVELTAQQLGGRRVGDRLEPVGQVVVRESVARRHGDGGAEGGGGLGAAVQQMQ